MKVAYCSLNTNDVQRMSAIRQNDENILPQIPGAEFSGEIVGIGNYTVENLKVGDKVVALLCKPIDFSGKYYLLSNITAI